MENFLDENEKKYKKPQLSSINDDEGESVPLLQVETKDKKPQSWGVISFGVFLLLGAIWGSAFTFIKTAQDPHHGFTALAMVFLRLLSGGSLMLIALIVKMVVNKKFRKDVIFHLGSISTIAHLFVMGFFNNLVPFSLVGYAEGPLRAQVGITSILDSSIPIFAIPLAGIFLPHEKMTILKFIGLLIGFLGVILVCLQSVTVGGVFRLDDLIGSILVTGASASYGIASVYAAKYLTHVPGMLCATGQILSAALGTFILSLVFDLGLSHDHWGFWGRADVWAWLSIAYLGVLSTFVAYMCFFYLVSTVGSNRQSMVGFLLPVFGIITGVIFFREWSGIAWYYILIEIAGCGLVALGVALTTFPPSSLFWCCFKIIKRSKKKPTLEPEDPILPEQDYEQV